MPSGGRAIETPVAVPSGEWPLLEAEFVLEAEGQLVPSAASLLHRPAGQASRQAAESRVAFRHGTLLVSLRWRCRRPGHDGSGGPNGRRGRRQVEPRRVQLGPHRGRPGQVRLVFLRSGRCHRQTTWDQRLRPVGLLVPLDQALHGRRHRGLLPIRRGGRHVAIATTSRTGRSTTSQTSSSGKALATCTPNC